jgi:CobQ-like glutamine amidotransferase family enzyme
MAVQATAAAAGATAVRAAGGSGAARKLAILHLYPREMNIYGDHGNLLALVRRLQWRGFEVEVADHHPGDGIPAEPDIVLGGGGQDSGQTVVAKDLRRIGPALGAWVEQGVPALVVCGTYQLFGSHFQTTDGETIEGLGIFDLHTEGGTERLIGNIVTASERFGEVVGYENHSGRTWLAAGEQPFAQVVSGAGNNGRDGTEGVLHRNAIGTYLHGPLLPKNPAVADFLIQAALDRRYGEGALPELDDALAHNARRIARTRPR